MQGPPHPPEAEEKDTQFQIPKWCSLVEPHLIHLHKTPQLKSRDEWLKMGDRGYMAYDD